MWCEPYQDFRAPKSSELDCSKASASGGSFDGIDTPEEDLHVPIAALLSLSQILLSTLMPASWSGTNCIY